MAAPLVAVADLHGHLARFEVLLRHLDRELGSDYRLVTLGDYVDNGPEIPALLDRLIALSTERAGRFFPIIGNHDLACLRTLGWDGAAPDAAWWTRWRENYGGWSTAKAYRGDTLATFAARFPAAHRDWLQALPWFHATDGFTFVHAGLHRGDAASQLAALARREPLAGTHLHDALREKSLSIVSDAAWGSVVVSGHTKRPADRVAGGHPNAPHFATAHRITLNADVDEGGALWAVVLPERRLIGVRADGRVETGTLVPA